MILDLLWLSLIVALVYLSGFWTYLDDYISTRFKFHHLPHLLSCALCQTWWLSLLYIIIAGKLSLLGIVFCLVNAHLVNILIPLLTTIYNAVLRVIGAVAKYIK